MSSNVIGMHVMVYALLLRIDHVGVRATTNAIPNHHAKVVVATRFGANNIDLVQYICSIYLHQILLLVGANPSPSFLPSRSNMVMHSIIGVAETGCPTSLGWSLKFFFFFFFSFSGCAIIYIFVG